VKKPGSFLRLPGVLLVYELSFIAGVALSELSVKLLLASASLSADLSLRKTAPYP
jgi:hypothetical protein